MSGIARCARILVTDLLGMKMGFVKPELGILLPKNVKLIVISAVTHVLLPEITNDMTSFGARAFEIGR